MKLKFYESIDDMPVYNWFKCVENKKYKFVLLFPGKFKDSDEDKYKEAFKKVYAEYVDEFGINEHLKDIIDLQNEILCLKIDLALTKDNFNKTLIEFKELELLDKLNKKTENTNMAKIAIEKYLNFRLNLREVTVKEYYDYLKVVKDHGRPTDR